MRGYERKQHRYTALPDYSSPPINEVVCGVRFTPLPNLKIPHVGLLWGYVKDKFPKVEHAQPIGNTDGSVALDDVLGLPLPRIWFINEVDDNLIQLQADRLLFNWRKRDKEYPRYSNIFSDFEEHFKTFSTFVAEQKLGDISPVEFDLTYVNQIPAGDMWQSMEDISKIFPDVGWNATSHSFLPPPTNLGWNLRFDLPDNLGYMEIKLNQGKRTSDGNLILILELAAKGVGTDRSLKGMREWFDVAHQWIVTGFADITARTIQSEVWGRKNA